MRKNTVLCSRARLRDLPLSTVQTSYSSATSTQLHSIVAATMTPLLTERLTVSLASLQLIYLLRLQPRMHVRTEHCGSVMSVQSSSSLELSSVSISTTVASRRHIPLHSHQLDCTREALVMVVICLQTGEARGNIIHTYRLTTAKPVVWSIRQEIYLPHSRLPSP